MSELMQLPNIGKEVAKQLEEVGITTIAELKKTGSKEAWLRIKSRDPSACIMRLSALEGAIQGIRWHYLDAAVKAELKAFYQQNK